MLHSHQIKDAADRRLARIIDDYRIAAQFSRPGRLFLCLIMVVMNIFTKLVTDGEQRRGKADNTDHQSDYFHGSALLSALFELIPFAGYPAPVIRSEGHSPSVEG